MCKNLSEMYTEEEIAEYVHIPDNFQEWISMENTVFIFLELVNKYDYNSVLKLGICEKGDIVSFTNLITTYSWLIEIPRELAGEMFIRVSETLKDFKYPGEDLYTFDIRYDFKSCVISKFGKESIINIIVKPRRYGGLPKWW